MDDTSERAAGHGAGRGAGERWGGAAGHEAHAAVVLRCVLARLAPRDLWRCGAVCHAWRCAAADDALWRRALRPHAPPRALRALASATRGAPEWSWRAEYARAAARWRARPALATRGAGGAALRCVTLNARGDCVALVDENAMLTIFELPAGSDAGAAEAWRVRCAGALSDEWRDVQHAQWAPAARALLLAARLALVERHEILVVGFDESWRRRVLCRCAGAVAAWLHDGAFLSLQLHVVAPGRACTTVWLNAASQETQSEHAGVAAPLMRVYNEDAAHISHIVLANVPTDSPQHATATDHDDNDGDDGDDGDGDDDGSAADDAEPGARYYHALRPLHDAVALKRRFLVAAGGGGGAGARRGIATALLLWALPGALPLPPLRVADRLAQRVQRRRSERQRTPPPEPPAPPDEAAVRALCTSPAAVCPLHHQIFGLVVHPRGRCVWAATAGGACCVSLPALRPLLCLAPRAAPLDATLPPHYVAPAVDDDYFATPAGGGAAHVDVWTARGALPGAMLPAGGPAHAALLLPRAPRCPHVLLVLTAEALQVWQSA